MARERDGAAQMEFNLNALDENVRLQSENRRLRAENERLLSEIERLRQLLKVGESVHPSLEMNAAPELTIEEQPFFDSTAKWSKVTKHSAISDKVALFRSFFRGRDDVYAVRRLDKSGKPAYFRARDYLGKENGRAVWGGDLPLTDEIIADHLQREDRPVTVGLYPLLLDETCWFLAIDFDKTSWREDSTAFLEVR